MSPTTPSAKTSEDKPARKAEPSAFPVAFEGSSELMWLPYRTMLDLLCRNHAGMVEMLSAQRKFGDDLREMARSHQDMVLNLSERFLNQLSKLGSEMGATELYGKSLGQLQDATLATMREIGAAVAAAQASSLEAIEHQMHLDQPAGSDGRGRETAH